MTLPTYFLSHGGGPWPFMKERTGGAYDVLESSLAGLPRDWDETPDAILMVSGHWEEPRFTVQAAERPPMIYDYSGFPEHTYRIRYDAPGSPSLAARVREMLGDAGMDAALDTERGYDHGVYAPLAVVYPSANVPVVQLSIRSDYDPRAHLEAGKAIAGLRDENVVVLASGLSYHNLRNFGPSALAPSRAFDAWLTETLCSSPADERERRLLDWAAAPSARLAHPREDHLIPLLVAVGAAASERAERIYHEDDFFGGIAVSSYRFGKPSGRARA